MVRRALDDHLQNALRARVVARLRDVDCQADHRLIVRVGIGEVRQFGHGLAQAALGLKFLRVLHLRGTPRFQPERLGQNRVRPIEVVRGAGGFALELFGHRRVADPAMTVG